MITAAIGIACFVFGFLLAAWGAKEHLSESLEIHDANKNLIRMVNELSFEANELRKKNESLKRIIKPERGKV